MRIRLTMMRVALAWAVALAYIGLTPATPAAADREHQQLMADLRMLQEQTQQLQALMNGLGEALKQVSSRLDDQASLERKAFADSKVQMDTISGDLRIVREKIDETNVRVGSVFQELESLRQAIPESGSLQTAPPTSDGAIPGATPPQAAGTSTTPMNPGSPQRAWQSSFADYMSGNYSLAVIGFQSFLSSFPKSSQAHEAQLFVGESLLADKKDADAVTAYDRVIANYPRSASVPQAYYKRGRALENLREPDRARESYETVIKEYPDTAQANLAKQRLEALKTPAKK
ncbi:MAG TPA: tol-pal system protein YbgF [Vicinamibacterales bacterium]|nr:tol-pal system protein YbgF [Vicinamibacterales bacterium]